ncbi:MAG: hypothetical protein ACOCVF_03410 [bacterium]
MISINKDIRNILINDNEINSIVDNKIYTLYVPDSSIDAPFIILNRLSNDRSYVKDEKQKDNIKFNIIVVHNEYPDCIDLAEKVDNLIDTYKFNNEKYKGQIRNTNIREAYTGEYMIDLEYYISIEYK